MTSVDLGRSLERTAYAYWSAAKALRHADLPAVSEYIRETLRGIAQTGGKARRHAARMLVLRGGW